jgi:ribosomal protein L11 methyltransferase
VTSGGDSPAETLVARLAGDEATLWRLADAFAAAVDGTAVAIRNDGRFWTMEAYFAAPPDETLLRRLTAQIAGEAAAHRLIFEQVSARDWVAASLQGLQPVAAGRFVVHGGHSRGAVPPNRLGIEIEAALAFGTGHHGTTRGCLLALDSLLKRCRPRAVLDVGAGTGVLAIAAARALRVPVFAGDIDRRAIAVARDNVRRNRVAGLVRLFQAAGVTAHALDAHRFDLILANILASPLQRMARTLTRRLRPGGRLVLSGLLADQANAVIAAYRAQELRLERRIALDEWVTLVMRRAAVRSMR